MTNARSLMRGRAAFVYQKVVGRHNPTHSPSVDGTLLPCSSDGLDTRWQSRVFAARCYAWARPMPSCGVRVCVCVCLSVTFVDCVKTIKHIFKKILPSSRSSHAIIVFPYQTSWPYSKGHPHPNGGVECRRSRLKYRFSTNIWLCNR